MKQFSLCVAILALIGNSDAIVLKKLGDNDAVSHTMDHENIDAINGESVPSYYLPQ